MAIDLLGIQPHKVSKDLSGYIIFVYGKAKTGKTTFATRRDDTLLLAFEQGYNALPGVLAQDINTWGEMRQVFRELKKPEVKERYKTVVIDTVDIAADLCQKYICNQLGIENMGDGGWGTNSWSKYKKEFEEVFRGLTMLGYAVIFISHDKEGSYKDKNGKEHSFIRPSTQSSALAIIENMADVYGYAHTELNSMNESEVFLTMRASGAEDIACGCRFKYIQPTIPFTYDALEEAVRAAIEKEAQMTDGKYLTNERQTPAAAQTYDFDALMAEFQDIVGGLMNKDSAKYAPIVTQIIDKYLGKGKKVVDATRDQAELIYLIVSEIKDDVL